jgi:hypothetical protein
MDGSHPTAPDDDLSGAEPAKISGRFLRAGTVALLLVIGAAVELTVPWPGPIVLTLLPAHGVDAGDLLAVPFLVLAAIVAFGQSRSPNRWSVAATIAAGLLLCIVGLARLGEVDDELRRELDLVVACLVVALLICIVVWSAGLFPRVSSVSRAGRTLLVAAGAGLLIDLLMPPSGTVFSAIFLLLALAVLVPSRPASVVAIVAAATLLVVSIMSLTDIAGVDITMATDQGGAARSASLGAALILVGAVGWPSSSSGVSNDPRPPLSDR